MKGHFLRSRNVIKIQWLLHLKYILMSGYPIYV